MKDLTNSKEFIGRHIGPSDEHIKYYAFSI